MANVYVGSVAYDAVAAWAALTLYGVGDIVRQLAAPAAGSERCFRCSTAGTSGAAEPTWTTTANGTTTDATAVWTECTGQEAYQGAGGVAKKAPHKRIANALATGWAAAGDSIYVDANHDYTYAGAASITFPGTVGSWNKVLCVSATSSVPPVSADISTGAKETSGDGAYRISTGFAEIYDLNFRGYASSGGSTQLSINPAADSGYKLVRCLLEATAGGSTTGVITIGPTGTNIYGPLDLIDTRFKFINVGQSIAVRSAVVRITGAGKGAFLAGGSVPTTLFNSFGASSTFTPRVFLNGVDLSELGAGKNIATVSAVARPFVSIVNCKLGSSVTLGTGTVPVRSSADPALVAVNNDSADTNYKYLSYAYAGTVQDETTIVRTGGASDGTTPISLKMVSNASATVLYPLQSSPAYFWNDTAGSSKTVSLETVTDGVTLKDNEAWIEVEYLGTSGFPLSLFINDAVADPLAAAANQPTSSETWTTTGLASPVKQTLGVTFTPQEKGLFRAVVMLAKASTTMYLDLKLTVA